MDILTQKLHENLQNDDKNDEEEAVKFTNERKEFYQKYSSYLTTRKFKKFSKVLFDIHQGQKKGFS